MQGAKFSYCTVCKAQKAQYARHKIDRYVENRLFCKKKLIYRVAACFASWCRQLVVWQNISQQLDISTKHQLQRPNSFQDSPILSIRLEVLNWHVSGWRCWTRGSITSIPTRIASSVLSRLCCPSIRVSFALQIVQSASLHSFKFVFLVSART